ncbi:hypothetical protein BCR44DRAFT_29667 [Catenaria anguillulae PL171]|uniref:Uncharacterized protein n=1 Tax=Catenaria anguillulae PL171 TaxID=765915 RepID=A0A1Y2HZM6_9FUNG|nr:hypothetical protein BCR44DRAFT_29667 [Catenaria anguillulae PL171]
MADIGLNLTDPMFRGCYHGKQKHQDDLVDVLERARASGVDCMMLTGGTLSESEEALNLALQHDGLVSTVGCHPTRCNEFEKNPDKYYADLLALAKRGKELGKVVAVGECGLDYDRLHFCKADVQKKHFPRQFQLAAETGLPMFLHDRNTGGDMHAILKAHRDQFSTGVVHSFTGTLEEMQQHVDMDLYIGINGCSLKTQENLEVLKQIPLDKLMLETDAPWCDIRPTHASHAYVSAAAAVSLSPTRPSTKYPFPSWFFDEKTNVAKKHEKHVPGMMMKSRNEPCGMVKVLVAVAAIRGEEPAEVASVVWENTCKVFGSPTGQ